jgi:hypothetical protein
MTEMTVQSYGAGVQSRAMLHMAIQGLMPKPDIVIFADTQAEPESVYEAVKEDALHAQQAGIRFESVTHANLAALEQFKGVYIPAFTVNYKTGKKGMLRRQCTMRFKVEPIRRYLRTLGVKKAHMLLGITTDEAVRVKDSPVKWITHVYPFIERNMNRDDCERYLSSINIKGAKSACVFCPYRSPYGWAKIRQNQADWQLAVEYDKKLRDKFGDEWGGSLYVHPDMVPLEQASVPDLSTMPRLFDDGGGFGNECEGHCGV